MIEQIISRELLKTSGSLFYFYRTHAGAEIDLIIEGGSERVGYEFKCSVSIGKRDWSNLRAGIDEGVIHKGILVYMGDRNFPVAEQISVLKGEKLLLSKL